MNRPRVRVAGRHPALYITRQWLIQNGAELVDQDEDYLVVGGLSDSLVRYTKVPTLVLSSSDVYWNPDISEAFSEDQALSVPSTRDISSFSSIQCLYAEAAAFRFTQRALVLRTFNVFGPAIPGFISALTAQSVQGQEVTIPSPGYQERTFLYEDDYLEFFSRFWFKFVEGLSGIYNVGSSVPLSLCRTADIVWQRTRNDHTAAPVRLEQLPFKLQWSVVPDMTRTHAEVAYRASTTLSMGIWKSGSK